MTHTIGQRIVEIELNRTRLTASAIAARCWECLTPSGDKAGFYYDGGWSPWCSEECAFPDSVQARLHRYRYRQRLRLWLRTPV
jgi:hypothetical protein